MSSHFQTYQINFTENQLKIDHNAHMYDINKLFSLELHETQLKSKQSKHEQPNKRIQRTRFFLSIQYTTENSTTIS